MKQSYVIGVDISKSKIDCAVLSVEFEVLNEKEVVNTDLKIRSFLFKVINTLKVENSEILICCENTGVYNRPLERVCQEMGIDLWVEHALKIKRACTDMRGKTDRRDALRIAEYAIRYQDRKVLHKESPKVIQELKEQLKVRETLIGLKIALENQLREAKSHDVEIYKILKAGYAKTLNSLTKSIADAELRINELTKKDEKIEQNVHLMTSIPGIGKQSAVNFIIATNNFESFSSAKHLACYAGVVPFQNQSGTIVKRERVSKMANQTLKKLLHMSAMAAIRFDPELKAYYQRKVQEGKNKMSVLNAVRNKLVHRIIAVVTKEKLYEIKNTVSIKKETLIVAS